jgi:Right handed beta helix region
MNNVIPANTVVHFAAGNYQVSSLTPKPGVQILGAGKDVTNFLWDGETQLSMISSYGGAHGALVSDLTLNGQQDVWGQTPMAINFFDSNNVTIRNVRATNFRGGNSEAFLVTQFGQDISVIGAMIENCEVDHFIAGPGGSTLLGFAHGGSGSPSNRISGTVQNNYIHDCPGVQALNGGGTNSIYQGNLVVGADKGWYHDTYPASGTQILNNQFLNCTSYGIVATSVGSGTDEPFDAYDGLLIKDNIITLDPSVWTDMTGVAMWGAFVTNVQVINNTVIRDAICNGQYGFSLNTGPGLIEYGNQATAGLWNFPN